MYSVQNVKCIMYTEIQFYMTLILDPVEALFDCQRHSSQCSSLLAGQVAVKSQATKVSSVTPYLLEALF